MFDTFPATAIVMTSLSLTVGLLLSVCTFSLAARIDLPIQLQNTYVGFVLALLEPFESP